MKSWKSNQDKVRRKRRRVANKPPVGSSPGTLVLAPGAPQPRIRAVRYTAGEFEEREIHDPEELASFCRPGGTLWVDVQGLGDRAVLEWIGAHFQLHPLLLSDVVHVPQRPKAEAYDGTTFVVARRLKWRGDPDDPIDERQISLVVGERHVLSFQEREDDVFEPVRARLVAGGGLSRRSGTDYLLYTLLDAIVDDYLPVMDKIGECLESLEERVVSTPSRTLVHELAALRGDLIGVRRDVWPLREALNALLRGDAGKISEPVRVYLRDVYDHCVQVAEVVEMYRELGAGLLNLYLTALANRTNDVMRVLTVVATIFIPLTFIVGVYGMNFDYQPEMHWRWAYPALWAIMIAIAVGMLAYFRRKGWLGKPPE
jgi:magnesium transporter